MRPPPDAITNRLKELTHKISYAAGDPEPPTVYAVQVTPEFVDTKTDVEVVPSTSPRRATIVFVPLSADAITKSFWFYQTY